MLLLVSFYAKATVLHSKSKSKIQYPIGTVLFTVIPYKKQGGKCMWFARNCNAFERVLNQEVQTSKLKLHYYIQTCLHVVFTGTGTVPVRVVPVNTCTCTGPGTCAWADQTSRCADHLFFTGSTLNEPPGDINVFIGSKLKVQQS